MVDPIVSTNGGLMRNLGAAIFRTAGGKLGFAILAVSALVAGWIAINGGLIFFIDSVDFFNYAVQLRHLNIGSYYYTIGYPILIFLTGFTRTGSIIPLFILQGAFAALIPWLAFKTFSEHSIKAGVAAGLTCLVSLTPYFFENTFFHDETSLFFGLLALTFASAFFRLRETKYIYLSSLCAIYAFLAQPAVIGFFVSCFGAIILRAFRDRSVIKHVFITLAIFGIIVIGVKKFEISSMRHRNLISEASQLGRQIFFNEYVRASSNAPFTGLSADRLRTALVNVFKAPPDGIRGYIMGKLGNQEATYQRLFGQYEGHPVQLVSKMFSAPNRDYFEVMWNLPDLSRQITDRMFLSASLAFLYYHPLAVIEYTLSNIVDFAKGPGWHCQDDAVFPDCRTKDRIAFYPSLSDGVVLSHGKMPDKAYRFITARHVSSGWLMQAMTLAWPWIYYNLRLPFLSAMVFGWLASFWASSELRWTLSAIVGCYVINVLLFSFLVEPLFRYQVLNFSVSAFAAGAGGYLILQQVAHAVVGFRRVASNSPCG